MYHLKILLINLAGLRGRHHPALPYLVITEEVKKSRPHLKFLTGDYLTYQMKFDQSGSGSPLCGICILGNEQFPMSLEHVEPSMKRKKQDIAGTG